MSGRVGALHHCGPPDARAVAGTWLAWPVAAGIPARATRPSMRSLMPRRARFETGRSGPWWPERSQRASSIGARGFEPRTSPTRTVRATRLRHAPKADQYDKSAAARRSRGRSIAAMRSPRATRRLAATLLLLSAGLGACGGSGDSAQGRTTAPARATVAAASCPAAGRHAVDGGVLVVPPGAKAGAVPLLVVVIPGGGGDPRDGLGLARAARRAGLALLYPTSSDGFWSLNHRRGDADVTSVRGLLERTLAAGASTSGG